eukprot:gene1207-4418_t
MSYQLVHNNCSGLVNHLTNENCLPTSLLLSSSDPRFHVLVVAAVEGIIPALITPFLSTGEGVDENAVREIVKLTLSVKQSIIDPVTMTKFHLDAGVSGFYLCGSTGEGLNASTSERKAMVVAVIQTLSELNVKLPVVVMVAAPQIDDAIDLAVHAQEAGADAVSSVVPVSRPNDLDAAVAYWSCLSEACSLPLYVYWIAHTADRNATAATFLEAMQRVPTFAGIKFTDTNFFMFEQLISHSKGKINAVTGPDEMMGAGSE